MSAFEIVVLALAGLAAGAANTVAGGGTFISYPTLIAMGYPPIVANVTSAVGLVSGYAGGSLSYKRELVGQGKRLVALGPSVVLGSVSGALLLLFTPNDAFELIVPWLVLLSCALLLAQPRIKAAVARHRQDRDATSERLGIGVHAGVFIGAVYGTYFGAGLGVVLLAVLGIFVVDRLQRINGLRTALSLLIKVIGVAVFLFSGQVAWLAAGILAITAYVGGTLGATISRRLSENVLRWTVILCGLTVAVVLLV